MTVYAIDRTRVPNASLKVLQRLAKTLRRDTPEQTNEIIEHAGKRLDACIAEVDRALTARVREVNPQIVATEVEFDRATDAQWIWLRKQLEGVITAYSHPGLDALPEDLREKAGLAALRLKADRARKLHERLFGAEGTAWVQRPYVEQVETMAAHLRLIHEDELTDELESVVGPETLPLLETLQIHYEDMVSSRMSRSTGPVDNFRDLRAKLRWKIDRYKNAVESLRDDEDPASFELVDRSLRSLLMLAERVAKTSTAEFDEELDDELLGEGLVEIGDPLAAEPETDDDLEAANAAE